MLLDYYEETLKDIEDIAIRLDNLSNKDLHHTLQTIVNRGWLQIETMFGQYSEKNTKEEIQEHFNAMLNVVPMTKVKKTNDKT
jgi:hypothetical protein